MGILSMYVDLPESPVKEPSMKRLYLFFITTCMLLLAGCNTVTGVGKDVSAAGNAIERAGNKR
jgi:predicted small secreted protein